MVTASVWVKSVWFYLPKKVDKTVKSPETRRLPDLPLSHDSRIGVIS